MDSTEYKDAVATRELPGGRKLVLCKAGKLYSDNSLYAFHMHDVELGEDGAEIQVGPPLLYVSQVENPNFRLMLNDAERQFETYREHYSEKGEEKARKTKEALIKHVFKLK